MRRTDQDKLVSGRLTDALAHLYDRDFKSDRPGRVFDHAPLVRRRGATAPWARVVSGALASTRPSSSLKK